MLLKTIFVFWFVTADLVWYDQKNVISLIIPVACVTAWRQGDFLGTSRVDMQNFIANVNKISKSVTLTFGDLQQQQQDDAN